MYGIWYIYVKIYNMKECKVCECLCLYLNVVVLGRMLKFLFDIIICFGLFIFIIYKGKIFEILIFNIYWYKYMYVDFCL